MLAPVAAVRSAVGMKPLPNGWPTFSAFVYYDDAPAAIEWLCAAFGFEVRINVPGPDGKVMHCELMHRDGLVMIASVGAREMSREDVAAAVSPRSLDGRVTQIQCVRVDDVDAHCERARAAGAPILVEPLTDDYGPEFGAHRSYLSRDPEGHCWWFLEVVREGQPAG